MGVDADKTNIFCVNNNNGINHLKSSHKPNSTSTDATITGDISSLQAAPHENAEPGPAPNVPSKVFLNNFRVENISRVIFAHLNINSIRNKLGLLKEIVVGKLDILLVSESKLDESFPISQFAIPGFATPYRLDRTANGGGLLMYIREHIPSRAVNIKPHNQSFECIFMELNLYKKKIKENMCNEGRFPLHMYH